ncbi:MAG: WD40 repeat domain-containing protein [Acidimicrobiales bacterium]
MALYNVAKPRAPRLLKSPGGFTNYAYDTAFTPNGRTLVAGSADGTVRLWDLSDPSHPRILADLQAAEDSVFAVGFDPARPGPYLPPAAATGLCTCGATSPPRQPARSAPPLATASPGTNGLSTSRGTRTAHRAGRRRQVPADLGARARLEQCRRQVIHPIAII